MRLFHTTEAAGAILAGGFRDAEGSYGLFETTLRGVFLSRTPADVNEGAKGDEVLEVVIPDNIDLADYAILEENRPAWEWCVPADLINRYGRVRLLSEEEVDRIHWA